MPEIIEIARCPEHGLHGKRVDCFACGGTVEQVKMVPLREYERLQRALAEAQRGTTARPWHKHAFSPGQLTPRSCLVCGHAKEALHHA